MHDIIEKRSIALANSCAGKMFADAIVQSDTPCCDDCGYPSDPLRFALLQSHYMFLKKSLSKVKRQLYYQRYEYSIKHARYLEEKCANLTDQLYKLATSQDYGKLKPCGKCKLKYNPTNRTRCNARTGERTYPKPTKPKVGERLIDTLT